MSQTRRRFLATVGTAATMSSLSGCMGGGVKGNFRLTDIGLIKRHNGVAAFVEAKNISNGNRAFEGYLAAYGEDNVRVSDWEFVSTGYDSEVRPNKKVRVYSVYRSRDAGWVDSSHLGQVVDAYSSKFRLGGSEPRGKPFSEEDIGEILDLK